MKLSHNKLHKLEQSKNTFVVNLQMCVFCDINHMKNIYIEYVCLCSLSLPSMLLIFPVKDAILDYGYYYCPLETHHDDVKLFG